MKVYSISCRGKHYFNFTLVFLAETHGNFHDVVEFPVADGNLFKIVALTTIALFWGRLTGMIQIAFVANIIHDIASLLPVDVVYI